jgi:prepilin-type N-terminal cleavage/methylation domain-containing protein/prepilin-type processing-associated H-X9-DG protein
MYRHTRTSWRALARRSGFTLVELLVVIGIIAVLIGVLLPVLAGVAARGRDLKCQANMRTALQMVMVYAAENKGSLPYGYYFNRGFSHTAPFDWNEMPGNGGRLTTVFALLSRMSGKQYKGDDVFADLTPGQTEAPTNTAPFFRCPEAEQVLPHICSYVVQFVAFCTPYNDRRLAPYPKAIQDRPARTKDLFPFTILIHDTAVMPGMINDVGYVTDADVDGQRMWRGAVTPQFRYYDFADPYSRIPPGVYGQNKPVGLGGGWKNIDPSDWGIPYQGNLRWRHNKNQSMNVGYADGRVESVQAKFKSDNTLQSTHNVLRKSFMIKWPSGMGIQRDTSVP